MFGRSFLTAGAMMALIALPLIVGGTREALQAIPRHVREASYALGKTKPATIRRVLLPGRAPGIATGTALGMGRIAGDTAIVVILLGASLQLQRRRPVPGLGTLSGTGSTLTTYVYNNSPAGEGARRRRPTPRRSCCWSIVVPLNFAVDRSRAAERDGSGHRGRHGRSAARRVRRDPSRWRADDRADAGQRQRPRATASARPRPRGAAARRRGRERMRLEELTIAYGGKVAVNRSRCRSARARCSR